MRSCRRCLILEMILSTAQVFRGRYATYRLLNTYTSCVNSIQSTRVKKPHGRIRVISYADSCNVRYASSSVSGAVVKIALEHTKKACKREQNNCLVPGNCSSHTSTDCGQDWLRRGFQIYANSTPNQISHVLNHAHRRRSLAVGLSLGSSPHHPCDKVPIVIQIFFIFRH